MAKKLFCCLSPVILILLCGIFAFMFKDLLSVWIYIPSIMVLYWGLTLILIQIGIKLPNIKSVFSKPEGKIYWLFIAIIVGILPLITFLDNYQIVNIPLGLIILMLFSLVNAFFEELFWRGFILNYTFSSKILSFFYSAVLFTASHFVWGITSLAVRNIYTIVSVFIMAVAWNIINIKTKSIRWCIVSHFLADVLGLSLLSLLNIYIPAAGLLY
ncbi:MAG: CPBP family intramembrane metalloprotease [Treponema sp.]|nr:CPBP family intramembrane metalloprotease [Treponema sp.]